VVDGLDLENRPELLLGFRKAADAEVRDAEGLADRGLARLPPLRLLERDGRLGGEAGREVLTALLVEVVGLAHLLSHDTQSATVCRPPDEQLRRPSSR
jgi:hypothetical protein